jgi:Prenyltransferase and squalene oxidase repeat
LQGHVRQLYRDFTSRDYLGFDPAREAPPALGQRSRYEVWRDALVLTYTADGFGMPLPASYADVARWAPAMRPYPNPAAPGATEFRDVVYAITHLVYTLNDYNRHRLLPEWLPQEFEYLRAHLKRPLEGGDPELLGEFVDCLRAFGLPDTDPDIAAGIDYLLRTQNADGSWGAAGDADSYHTTWTAIDALRDYQWAELAEVPGAIRSMLAVSCDAVQ